MTIDAEWVWVVLEGESWRGDPPWGVHSVWSNEDDASKTADAIQNDRKQVRVEQKMVFSYETIEALQGYRKVEE